MNEKEKVIGGLLNINQFFWLLSGLAVSALVFGVLVSLIGGTGAIIVAFPFLFVGTPFAFYKKKHLTLYQYITLKRKFKKKNQKLPNKRKEVKL